MLQDQVVELQHLLSRRESELEGLVRRVSGLWGRGLTLQLRHFERESEESLQACERLQEQMLKYEKYCTSLQDELEQLKRSHQYCFCCETMVTLQAGESASPPRNER